MPRVSSVKGVQETRSGLLRAGCSGGGGGGGKAAQGRGAGAGADGWGRRQRASVYSGPDRGARGGRTGCWQWGRAWWCQSTTGCWVLGAGRTGKIRAVEGLVFDLGGSRSARADSSHALGLKSSPARRSQNQLDGAVLELGEGWGEQR